MHRARDFGQQVLFRDIYALWKDISLSNRELSVHFTMQGILVVGGVHRKWRPLLKQGASPEIDSTDRGRWHRH